jgi:hypothetical protein
MAGLGTPLAAVVVVVLVVTFNVPGVNFVFESFFGEITEPIACVLPSLPATVGPSPAASAAEATIAVATATASPTIKVERLRIESLLRFELARRLPYP